MKKNVFLGLLAMLLTLTGCQNNWSDVLVSMSVETNGATFVEDDFSDIEYVREVYSKALMATGKVEQVEENRNYVIRRLFSTADATAVVKEAMEKAKEELKDYKSNKRSELTVVYTYQFGTDAEMEMKSPNYGTSYTEADVESVVIKYRLNLNLTEDSTLAAFKDMTKGYAVRYYDVENDKIASKNLTFDEIFEAQYSAKKLTKAGYAWYVVPKDSLPTVSVRMMLAMQTIAEVCYKDGRKSTVEMGGQYSGNDASSSLGFRVKLMPQLCSLENRFVTHQGAIYTFRWSEGLQNYEIISME